MECHTPLKTLLPAYHDKFVLVAGYKETIEAIHEYGFKKAKTVQDKRKYIRTVSEHTASADIT